MIADIEGEGSWTIEEINTGSGDLRIAYSSENEYNGYVLTAIKSDNYYVDDHGIYVTVCDPS